MTDNSISTLSLDRAETARPLPDLAHLAHVPAGIAAAALVSLCASASRLPFSFQVFAGARKAAGQCEGLVLLQRGRSEGGTSLWIAPAYIPAAVELIADGAPTQEEHQAGMRRLLESGLQMDAGVWHQLRRRLLRIGGHGFTFIQKRPCSPEEVLAAWRGEGCAWQGDACGRSDVEETLERVVLRAQAEHPDNVEPLVQALRRALGRNSTAHFGREADAAYVEWKASVAELLAFADLSRTLALDRYPQSFHAARAAQRRIRLFVGPPNSGKTHAAFEALKAARSGLYLAPLRLLALEGRDRMVKDGVPCTLLTGEERDIDPNARVTSSTVEMLNTQERVEVAVIDEAQMIFDASRGWAWTQALVGVPADDVFVICSAYAVPAVLSVLEACGERAEVQRFERKQHVQRCSKPVLLKEIEPGDALVAFSRRDVLMLRDQVEQAGRRVALIYGALPPEVRRREAERFATGEAPVLVATDAIGMGLNLPVRRVLFSTLQKYDGVSDRPLEVTEVHQIAGRAGRFGIQEEGFAGVLATAERPAARMLSERLAAQPQAPTPFKARVAPNAWHVSEIAARLQLTKLRPVLLAFMQSLSLESEVFEVAELDQALELAQQLDLFAGSLSLTERFVYSQAPVDVRSVSQVEQFLSWARNHAKTGRAGRPVFVQSVDEFSRLEEMEQALRLCTLWLWLDLRFAGVYGHLEAVLELRDELNRGIERKLRSKKPLSGRSHR